MRIDQKDRRYLTRRILSRLSPFLRSRLKKVPVVMAITVSLWLSPEALAEMVDHPTQIEMTNSAPAAPDVQTYTKEQLAEKPPQEIPGLKDEIRRQVGEVLRIMTARQDANNPALANLYNSKPIQTQTVMNIRRGLMEDDNSSQNELNGGLKEHVKVDMGKALATHITNNLQTWKELQQGFDFNLDFGKIFGGGSAPSAAPSSGKIRYGLIVKDIVPDESSPQTAAKSSMTPEDVMRYAGEADVVWTIGPVTEDSSAKLGAVSMPTLEQLHQQQQSPEAGTTLTERIPRPAFTGKVAPAVTADPAAVNSKAKPGMVVTLSQVQGYYEITKTTVNGVQNGTMEQQINIPIAGTMKIGRRYNDKMKVIRTHATEILVDKRLPTVNMIYHNMEDRYEANGSFVRGNQRVDVAAATPKGWKPAADNMGKHKGELYQVTYTKVF